MKRFRRKRLSNSLGVRLFLEDEETLLRQIKIGKFKDMFEAIRQSVNTNLTALRLKEFKKDTSFDGVKEAQSEVIQPIKVTIDNVEKNQN